MPLRLHRNKEPYWMEYRAKTEEEGAIRVRVLPLTDAIFSAAQAELSRLMRARMEKKAEEAGEEVSAPQIDEAYMIEWGGELRKALARRAIVGWEGFTEGDDDAEAPVSPENINDAMNLASFAQWFQREYIDPMGERRKEGNASGPGRSGSSAAGPNSAKAATRKDSPAPAEA